ncbi:MAG: GNVR domain-containing protein [Candidatus Palauibacterales bacterium]|nr:GNVR domain-containing protein [Candidatus Palauibacterales bacterium]MDP2584676.1 GNVR domain-containing protein [Candidatus Palauibacterales bacterium]
MNGGEGPGPARGPAGGPAASRAALTPLEAANVLLRHWRLVVGVPLALAFVVGLVGLLRPREYTSGASFMPNQGSSNNSALAGIAAQFGVNIGAQAGNSPEFYADLLNSHDLLRSAVLSRYASSRGGAAAADSGAASSTGWRDLVQIWEVSAGDSARSVEKAITLLGRRMTVGVRSQTGVVEVAVHTRDPSLSRQITSRLIDLVNTFNLETRQSQAGAQRKFIEGRLQVSRRQLLQSEDSLQAFLEHNRSYQNSPELQFEESRLQRHVDLRQQVYTSLAQSYEQARIDEVRTTPVITVVDPPELPARPDRRHLFLYVGIALVLGGIVGIVLAFAASYLERAREMDPGEFDEFKAGWRSMLADVRGLARRLRRRRGGA